MVSAKDAKDWARENMVGLWTSPMIPFEQDLSLSDKGIVHNVEYMLAVKASGLGYGFSEPWHCTLEERKHGMDVFVGAVAGRVPAYAHVTDHSIAETVGLAQHAAAVGADAIMLWAPYEFAKSQEMMFGYFEYVASKVDIAMIVYNTHHSGRSLNPETIERLSHIPNVCALKDAVNDMIHTTDVVRRVGEAIVVSDPLEEHLPLAITLLGQQVLLGTTSVFLMQSPAYQPVQEYVDLFRAGQTAEAWAKYHELQPLRSIWQSMYATLWDKSAAVHPIAMNKAWMDLMGMHGGPVRPPGSDISAAERRDLEARIQSTGWLDRLFPASGE
jgi:4-hydroxy-tetrahydrodipicolinate synthase